MKKNNQFVALNESLALNGKIVSPSQATEDPAKRRIIEISHRMARMAGAHLYAVKWDDGCLAMIPCDPNDRAAWRNALVQVHRQIAAGASGPVQFGAAQ